MQDGLAHALHQALGGADVLPKGAQIEDELPELGLFPGAVLAVGDVGPQLPGLHFIQCVGQITADQFLTIFTIHLSSPHVLHR